tara:strand:+ start:470 stop:961 length:492 start_codon:yes stop_codon:yes gene_type:complete
MGHAEQRIEGGIVDIVGKVDALLSDVRGVSARVQRLETTGARMLDGYHEILDVLAGMRTIDKARDEQMGNVAAELGRISKRLGLVEKGPREGSSPMLEDLARIGVRMAELHAEDEDTQVRDRRALVMQRAETRALVMMWVRRAALVLGPLLTYLLTRYLGGSQ